jgi:pyruvate dehydrogenase E2 component (dihydrolipoamide acetyltransferase)
MAKKVIMPKLGMAMSEGKVVKWLEDDGAEVQKGDPVVVVMSKKITYEVEAPAGGIVRHVAQPKDELPVGGLVGFVLQPGEEMPDVEEIAPVAPGEAPTVEKKETKAEKAEEAAPAEEAVEEEPEFVKASPAARRLAEELGVSLAKVEPTGPRGRVVEDDVRRHHEAQERILASPLARRIAEEEGLDLAQVEGSGPGGRIVEEDVLSALERREPSAPPTSIPFTGMRESIAEQMVHSLRTMAQLTITTKVDVTELKATRAALRERWDKKISYTDLLVKAVTVALADHPLLGARLEGDEILLPTALNIGVAVALEEGLMVPVIRDADQLTVPEISDALKDLAQRARSNELSVDEVTEAVFTVTNMGMFGVDAFTPIINPPEVAILGVGRIIDEVAWVNGQAQPRAMMTLSLTIDHRVVDGAPGGAFLQTLTQLLEHPALIFADDQPRGKE